MTLRQPNSTRVVRKDKATPATIQPGTRLCRYPGRDLLTGARIEAGADVRVVGEYEWYGPRTTHQKATEYGPMITGTAGIARELRDWAARGTRIAEAAAERAAERAEDADEASA